MDILVKAFSVIVLILLPQFLLSSCSKVPLESASFRQISRSLYILDYPRKPSSFFDTGYSELVVRGEVREIQRENIRRQNVVLGMTMPEVKVIAGGYIYRNDIRIYESRYGTTTYWHNITVNITMVSFGNDSKVDHIVRK